jgi:hypothetical protein
MLEQTNATSAPICVDTLLLCSIPGLVRDHTPYRFHEFHISLRKSIALWRGPFVIIFATASLDALEQHVRGIVHDVNSRLFAFTRRFACEAALPTLVSVLVFVLGHFVRYVCFGTSLVKQ